MHLPLVAVAIVASKRLKTAQSTNPERFARTATSADLSHDPPAVVFRPGTEPANALLCKAAASLIEATQSIEWRVTNGNMYEMLSGVRPNSYVGVVGNGAGCGRKLGMRELPGGRGDVPVSVERHVRNGAELFFRHVQIKQRRRRRMWRDRPALFFHGY